MADRTDRMIDRPETATLFIAKLIGISILAGAVGWWLGAEIAMLRRIFR